MTFSNQLLLLLAGALLCQACGPPPGKDNDSANGIWQSVGSGWILQISDSLEYGLYDVTSISCTPFRDGPFDDLAADLDVRADSLYLRKGVITYAFTRRDQMPAACAVPISPEKARDPVYNFEVFAQTAGEHYAFMDDNGIDWPEVYSKQRKKITRETTDAELFRVLDETLVLLKDNHAYLEAPGTDFQFAESPDEGDSQSSATALPEYGDFQVAQLVASHHLEEDRTADSRLIQWGRLNDSIGYMQVKAMWLFAELEIPQADIDELGYVDAYIQASDKLYEGAYIEKEVAGVSAILDRALRDLADSEALVIDVRFNGGGQDAVSFEILSRFLPDSLQVATQKLKYGDNRFTEPQRLWVRGVGKPYTKPLFILTSRQTGSAAEAFAIASMAMVNARRIGTPTSGALSTALEKTLPNGWVYSISNEIYMDTGGVSYEYNGVPVDYPLEYLEDRQAFFRSVVNDLKADKELILEAIGNLMGADPH